MVKLELKQEPFEGLHRALDKTKRTSQTVKVDREALGLLLSDFSKLLHICRGEFEDAEAGRKVKSI